MTKEIYCNRTTKYCTKNKIDSVSNIFCLDMVKFKFIIYVIYIQ